MEGGGGERGEISIFIEEMPAGRRRMNFRSDKRRKGSHISAIGFLFQYQEGGG